VEELTCAATHKSKRAIEKLLASCFPKPLVPDRVRKLPKARSNNADDGITTTTRSSQSPGVECSTPTSKAGAFGFTQDRPRHFESISPARRDEVAPLTAKDFKVQFTADAEFVAKLERARELLGPAVRRKDLAALFSKALDSLISKVENQKHGVTSRPHRPKKADCGNESAKPKARSRVIPRAVRRAVYERDGGQCAYVNSRGDRCSERSGLEYHHREAYGLGGSSTTANLELRCRSHNRLAAEQDYGQRHMAKFGRGLVKESAAGYEVAWKSGLSGGPGAHH
jgi:5-methylcytosine-specific restriction endonuclease McrA